MGWNPFEGETRTVVGTSVSRVIPDDLLPDSVKTGAIKALLGAGNLPEHLMAELVGGLGVRAERMYAWARDHYVHGLPSGQLYANTQGSAAVEAVIEQLEGQPVLMDYVHYGPPNALHRGWIALIAHHGYDPVTNELRALSAQKGSPVYLADMVVVVPEARIGQVSAGVLAAWGAAARAGYTPARPAFANGAGALIPPSPPVRSPSATGLSLHVTWVWQGTVECFEGAFSIALDDVGADAAAADEGAAGYFHAKYFVEGRARWFLYRNGAGTHPTLDAVFTDAPVGSGAYFPFLYFRHARRSVSADRASAAYRDARTLARRLGIDYDRVAQAIDQNPDVADVEQAMLTFAVPPRSTDPLECRYLFDYFARLYDAQGGQALVLVDTLRQALLDAPVETRAVVIRDARFRMALTHDGVYRRLRAGAVGDVGACTTGYDTQPYREGYADAETGGLLYQERSGTLHFFRRQIAPGLYEEILVRNLRMVYYVFGRHAVTADDTDPILLVPIDRSLTADYPIPARERLYARAMHFVFNSRVTVKLHWYQTDAFQVLMIVIAVVVTIATAGSDGGQTLGAALGLTGTAAVVATVILNLVIGQLLAIAYRLFVRWFGTEVATAVAILAIVCGGVQLVEAGGSVARTAAPLLLQLSSGLQQAVLETRFDDLLAEAAVLQRSVEEKTRLLESSRELLQNQHLLSPFVVFGEQPEDYFNRTIHFGNIGTLGITAISAYVDLALTLPRLHHTVGEALP